MVDMEQVGLTKDPFGNFERWMREAEAAGLHEPTAITLATADKSGRPSARVVLYKGLSTGDGGRKGFRLFTNYSSRKSSDLVANPWAALVFLWTPKGRQIRVEGRITRLEDQESDAYFASRPRGSRIGAWASPQSEKIKDRADLLARVAEVEKRFAGQEAVPRPPNWGGWLLVPERIEFWQAGEFRLHDRFSFEWTGAAWSIDRLAP